MRTPTSKQRGPWWQGETWLSLAQAAQALPPKGNGQHVSASRVYVWTTGGVRGVRLRRFKGPSGYLTTREECQRFVLALSRLDGCEE